MYIILWYINKNSSNMQELKYLEQFEKNINIFNEFNNFAAHYNVHTQRRKILDKKPTRFNPMSDLTNEEFSNKYHFTKENMNKIIEMMGDDLEPDNANNGLKNQVEGEIQVMIAIRCWALTEHPEITAAVHGVSYLTLQKICKRVATVFAIKASRFIRMPATLSEKEQVTSSFRALATMPQIIGTVIHKTVRVVLNDSEIKVDNTEGFIYVQIISDASLKIRDIDCKFQRRVKQEYNSKMFAKSRIKERMEQNEFRGRFLLGNVDMGCSNVLLTPLLLPRTEKEISFNSAHYITFKPALNCLNILSNRFGIIESGLHGSLNTAKNTIITLVLLHNLGIEWSDPSIEIPCKTLANSNCLNEILLNSEKLDCQIHCKIHQQEFIRNNF